MTEAFAIKFSDGEISLSSLALTEKYAWEYFQDKEWLLEHGAKCIPVTVSEKGEADELLRECKERITELCTAFRFAFPYATFDRIDAHLSRKEK